MKKISFFSCAFFKDEFKRENKKLDNERHFCKTLVELKRIYARTCTVLAENFKAVF